ncbi:hypothetical protein C9I98_11145 [Photobacterium sanctipauli]|uniref:Pilus assembly protein FimV n=4 Tax=Photobacterium sanctipauli TaxID=1342794 RepID=A0A2T3NT96_9GAMM|nr:hypothetical protein C9I98_11145 [Photobacterium sanctipauli]
MIKRLILPVLLTSAIQIPAQANTIRIIGPSAEEQANAASTAALAAPAAQTNASASRYGPTTNNETLWSIASRNRPSSQVSVYQVIGAIYRANPQAFENNNIHGLVPGSVLTMPSLAQVRREDTDAVKRQLEADQGRSATRRAAATPAPKPAPKAAPAPKPEPKVVAEPIPQPEPPKEEVVSEPKVAANSTDAQPEKPTLIPAKPVALQNQLDASDEQITKLLESNHLLRVRLAEMQHEVAALKDQISDDEVLREQIKGFIEQQRAQAVAVEAPQPSAFDRLIDNPWAVAAMALIPGALIAGLVAYFLLGRRKEEESDVKSLDAPEQASDPAMVAPPPAAVDDEPMPELALSDDNDIDDLFATDNDSLFDDPESSLFSNDEGLGGNGNDEFEIDSGLGPSSISVKGDDQAIGLQDMERALDEMDQKSEPSSDEALAAMWEQSLQSDDDDEDSFDLSDGEDDFSLDSSLDEQGIEDGLLDQSLLDDLLSEVEQEEKRAESSDEPAATPDVDPEQLIGQDELDSLFDSVAVSEAQDEAVDQALADADMFAASEAELLDTSDLDNVDLDDIDALLASESNSPEPVQAQADEQVEPELPANAESQAAVESPDMTQDDIESIFDANNTSLLDEMIEGDDDSLSSDIELEENSTALLDELLAEEAEADTLSTDVVVDENSTALLDELVSDLDDEEKNVDEALLADDLEPVVDIDNIDIEPTSTDLLDDILAQHSGEVEPAAEAAMPEPAATPDKAQEATQEIVQEAMQEPGLDSEFDPEFEQPLEVEQKPQQAAQQQEDADFPESAAFDDIFQEALAENTGSEPEAESVTGSEAAADDVDATLGELDEAPAESLNGAPDETIDTLVADVEDILSAESLQSSDEDDIETIGKTVDQLLESIDFEGTDFEDTDLESSDNVGFEIEAGEQQAAAQETAVAHQDVLEPQQSSVPQESPEPQTVAHDDILEEIEPDIDAILSGDDFPVFDEETALAEAEMLDNLFQQEDSLHETQPEPPQAEPINLDELPEFDEEAALHDPEAQELEEEMAAPELSADEEQAVLDNIVKQLQQAAEAAEPQQAERDALLQGFSAQEPSSAPAPEDIQPQVAQDESVEQGIDGNYSIHGEQDIAFEALDPAMLPEFGEDDALQASFDEQYELEQYEAEQGLKPQEQQAQPVTQSQDLAVQPQEAAVQPEEVATQPQGIRQDIHQGMDAFDQELVDTAGLDMDALLNEPQQDEAVQAVHEPQETAFAPHESITSDDEREQLLAMPEQNTDASADFGDEMSEEDSAIWAASNPEPELAVEDWADQPQMQDDEIDAFDTDSLLTESADPFVMDDEFDTVNEAGSELVAEDALQVTSVSPEELQDTATGSESYISIDELMKDLDAPEQNEELDEAPLNLEVGLDEFPDVLSGIDSYDVDSQGEYASKLDLAKAYLEMNDQEGAMGLLEEVASRGDGSSQQEAKTLLAKLLG